MTKEQVKLLKKELKKRMKKLSNSVLKKQLKKLNKDETTINIREILFEKFKKEMTIEEFKNYITTLKAGVIKILLSYYRI